MNKQNKKGIRFLNWFMTYNHTTHAPNSAQAYFSLRTWLPSTHNSHVTSSTGYNFTYLTGM
jgi:hypothetical protein